MKKFTDEDYRDMVSFTLMENGPYRWSWWQRDASALDHNEYSLSEQARVLAEMVREGIVKFIEVPKLIPQRRGRPFEIHIRIYYMDGGKWNDWLTSESWLGMAIR